MNNVSRLREHAFGLPRQWPYLALMLLAPLAAHWPLGPVLVPELPALYAAPALQLSDLAVAAVLFGGLGLRSTSSRALLWPLLALAGLALLTVPLALSQKIAVYTVSRWLLAVALAVALMSQELDRRQVEAALLLGLCLNALIGIAQVALQGPLGLPGEMAPPAANAGASIIVAGQARWLRAYGLTLHPNVLGGYLAVGLLLAVPLLERRRWRLCWWLLLAGLLLSFSRSAWLAVALALPPSAGWLAWRRPALRRPLGITLAGAALIALALAAVLAGPVQSRMRPASVAAEQRSLDERGEMVALALRLIGQRPLHGVGAGNFPVAMHAAGSPVEPQYVHNVPLLLAAELGVAGGALWLWLWLAPFWLLWRGRASPRLVALVGAWLALGVIALWDSYPWGLPPGQLLTATLLGLIGRAAADRDANVDQALVT
jgi:O-antigen ligase